MKKLILIVIILVMSPGISQAGFIWELRVGAKGGLTGNLFTEPDAAFPGSEPLWGDTQFFVGGGAGAFVEVRFFKFIGLEIDLLFESNSFKFNQSINTFEYDYITKFKQLRIPILLKGTLPAGALEFSLGVGPEFVVGLDAEVDFDYHTQLSSGQAEAQALIESLYSAEKANGTFLDFELGLCIKAWKFRIPIALRVGLNMTQADDYDDNVTLETNGTSIINGKIKAIESYHFTIMTGLAYVF